MYLICQIVNLNKKEERELMRMIKVPLLHKLDLSSKFLQALTHILKDALELGIMKL